MLMQMVPSGNESMQSDALVASELDHMATTQKDDDTTAAPKPSSFATISQNQQPDMIIELNNKQDELVGAIDAADGNADDDN